VPQNKQVDLGDSLTENARSSPQANESATKPNLYSEDELLLVSGVQHFCFCPRQWALIHIEQTWSENLHTVQGDLFHERVHDKNYKTYSKGAIIQRSLPLVSYELGLYGMSDLVEFSKSDGSAVIVEYKKGKKKVRNCDRAQLCAQALCLEEMLETGIERSFLFYGETREKEEVLIDAGLRSYTQTAITKMHELYRSSQTPAPSVKLSVCRQCSLVDSCNPKAFQKDSSHSYWSRMLAEAEKVEIEPATVGA